MNWKKLRDTFGNRWSPTLPDLDPTNRESRQEWILFMAHHRKRFPMTELNSALMPHVSRVTANKDVKELEERNLIRREKDPENRAYVVPIKQKEYVVADPAQERRRYFWNLGLPSLVVVLMMTLITILIKGY